MGMAASQVRLMQLTSRKNSIGYQLTMLSNEKVTLSREMSKVSKNYQNALNNKVLKWSNNSGVSYSDLSYKNLMKPSEMNQNTPYLITDTSGKIVVDSNYQKYAEMISADGKAGGDYDSNRTAILAELTGIDADKIESAKTTSEAVRTQADNIEKLQEETDKLKAKCTKNYTLEGFIQNCMGNTHGFNYYTSTNPNEQNSVGGDYSYTGEFGSGHWRLGQDASSSKAKLQELLNQLKSNVKNYLTDEDYAHFEEACSTTYAEFSGNIDQNVWDNASVPVTVMSWNENYYHVRIHSLLESLMGAYRQFGGSTVESSRGNGTYNFETINRESDDYKAYLAKKAELDAAKASYDEAVDTKNQVLTAEEESQIDFYDAIFSSIAEKGWTYNNQVNDTDYLNQMLQNNLYTITTVDRNIEKDENSGEYVWDNDYSTDIASNFTNIFSVNDSNAASDALVEYEYQKSLINAKETRIDTRMQDLETEQSSINQMIQGIESVRNENIERNFSIMG